ncbi:MAG: hypothetical protein HY821_22120 [Acidobacteria bacterium]|nr:hypothetical protein [Acidobacteriota bacterium]
MRYTILLVALFSAACSRAPKAANEVVAVASAKVPAQPDDATWEGAPEYTAKLVPQDLVEPRLMNPSTPEVRVRSVTNGSEIAFRLEWDDESKNDMPGPSRMVDACAVQIPEKTEKDLPEPQMGQEGKRVQVTYWRSDWQATVDGRGDTIRDIYPNATVDHYPFQSKALEKGSDAEKEMAQRYAPARALGNIRSGPRSQPVEQLVANGPGSLSPGEPLSAKGKGAFGKKGWAVVISRKLPEGLSANQRTHIAFAVWQGQQQESGARKMRSGWVSLLRKGE